MVTTTETSLATNVAARVAGEEVKPADYFAAVTEVVELPSFLWCCASARLAPGEPVRSIYQAKGAGPPNPVFQVCVPFVYAKQASGGTAIFEIRNHQLVRLDWKTGCKVRKRLRNGRREQRKQLS